MRSPATTRRQPPAGPGAQAQAPGGVRPPARHAAGRAGRGARRRGGPPPARAWRADRVRPPGRRTRTPLARVARRTRPRSRSSHRRRPRADVEGERRSALRRAHRHHHVAPGGGRAGADAAAAGARQPPPRRRAPPPAATRAAGPGAKGGDESVSGSVARTARRAARARDLDGARRHRPARQRRRHGPHPQHVEGRPQRRDRVEHDAHGAARDRRDADGQRPRRRARLEGAERDVGPALDRPRPHVEQRGGRAGARPDHQGLSPGGHRERRRHEGRVVDQARAAAQELRRLGALDGPAGQPERQVAVGRPRRQLGGRGPQQPAGRGDQRGQGRGARRGGEQGRGRGGDQEEVAADGGSGDEALECGAHDRRAFVAPGRRPGRRRRGRDLHRRGRRGRGPAA